MPLNTFSSMCFKLVQLLCFPSKDHYRQTGNFFWYFSAMAKIRMLSYNSFYKVFHIPDKKPNTVVICQNEQKAASVEDPTVFLLRK